MKRRLTFDRRAFLRLGTTGFVGGLIPWRSARPAVSGPAPEVHRYVTLGRTGFQISDVSFGGSRLRRGQEDLVRHALDRGVNYFDTAESYTGGASEQVIGNALGAERSKVHVVTKMAAHQSERAASMMSTLESSLRRLQTDYVDICFNHAVNDVERMQNPEWHQFVERAKRQGKIRYSGMSGHGGRLIECLDYALDHDLIDAMLVAYNFGQDPAFYERFTRSFDFVATQPDLPRVLEKAKRRNVGVVAMKTLMGGRLNDLRPYEQGGATFAQGALRWVLSNPNVDGLIISMTGRALIDEYLGASGWQSLAAGDADLLERYARLNGMSYCRHACNECEGACPYGVPIADVLRTRMYATDYEDFDFARREYAALEMNASACVSCTAKPCQGACPHGLAIDELCAPTHAMLS